MVPPRAWVVASESCSSTSPRATTSGSSLEISASKASPREQATCRPAAASCCRAAAASRSVASCRDSSSRSKPAWRVWAMARSTDAGEVSPTNTRACTPRGFGAAGVGMSVPLRRSLSARCGGAAGARRRPRQRRNRRARTAGPAGCGGAAPAGRPGPSARRPTARACTRTLPSAAASTGPASTGQAAGVGGQLAQQLVAGAAADEVHDVDRAGRRAAARRGRCAVGQRQAVEDAPDRLAPGSAAAAARSAGRRRRSCAGMSPGWQEGRVVGVDERTSSAGTAAASWSSRSRSAAGAALLPRAQRLLQQPQAHDVAQVADRAVDAQLVGEVGRAGWPR